MKTHKILPLLMTAFAVAACDEDRLDQNPATTYSDETVLATAESVEAVLMGGYMYAGYYPNCTIGKTSLESMANDITISDGSFGFSTYNWMMFAYNYVQYPRTVDGWWSAYAPYIWQYTYSSIDACNQIISNAETLPTGCEDILAQAHGLRAYNYFFLYNVFCQSYSGAGAGGQGLFLRTVPGNTDADANPVRSDLGASLDFIAEDLLYAYENITNTDNTLVTKDAAAVMLARVYMETGDYDAARRYVETVSSFTGGDLMSADEYTNDFSTMNDEWLWGLHYTEQTSNIYASIPSFWYAAEAKDAASTFGTEGYGTQTTYNDLVKNGVNVLVGYSTVRAAKSFVDTFQDGDCRKLFPFYIDLKDGYFMSKFRSSTSLGVTDYPLVRLAEAYLIEAECLLRTGDAAKGLEVLNTLQERRGGKVSSTLDLDEIWFERRRELYGEGFALGDMKRLQRPLERNDASQWSNVTSLPANSPRMMFPIPADELDYNPNATEADQNEYWR